MRSARMAHRCFAALMRLAEPVQQRGACARSRCAGGCEMPPPQQPGEAGWKGAHRGHGRARGPGRGEQQKRRAQRRDVASGRPEPLNAAAGNAKRAPAFPCQQAWIASGNGAVPQQQRHLPGCWLFCAAKHQPPPVPQGPVHAAVVAWLLANFCVAQLPGFCPSALTTSTHAALPCTAAQPQGRRLRHAENVHV